MKRLLICLILSLSMLGVRAQRDTLDLSGIWQSSLGECRLPGTTDENHLGGPRQTSEPSTQLTRLYPFCGQVIYERDVEIPESWQGRELTLLLERTKPSTLWIDGDSIGHICQLLAPYIYRLPVMKPGHHHIRLLLCTTDLQAIAAWPEGRAFAAALRRYAASPDFCPAYNIDLPLLRALLYSTRTERDIQGVRNITDYKNK